MSAIAQIVSALARHQTSHPKGHPTRFFVGRELYEKIHQEARINGVHAPLDPQFEDDRLECKGMRVYCRRAVQIEFEGS